MDDPAIVDLYFARDERAIRETADKYGRLCFSVAVRLLGSDADSEECVNDTYWSLWNKIPPVRPGNLMAFICKITRNLALKRLEHDNARKRAPEALVSIAELEEVLPDERFAPGVDDGEAARAISDFLRREKPASRAVFIRKYYFFDSVGDIAARYGFSESKVKNMLYHARNRLRDYLRKEGIEV